MELNSSSGISFISLYIICYRQKGILLHRNRRNIIASKQEASTEFHFKKLRGCTVPPATTQEIVFLISALALAELPPQAASLPFRSHSSQKAQAQDNQGTSLLSAWWAKSPVSSALWKQLSANWVAPNIKAALPFFFIQIIVSLIYGSSQHPNRLSQQSWEDTT